MPTSKASLDPSFRELALDLCWGAWAELGVSGWHRTHETWAIDPEPLIIFTAWFADDDRRLRDESLDWCTRYWRHVSKVRLKNLQHDDLDEALDDAWGEFAATVNGHARALWPYATRALRNYEPTGKSALRDLTEPSLAYLRMRAMFGLGARTEIMRELLFGHERWMTIAQLARATRYTKRNVADECENLQRAGVLKMREDSNRFTFSLAHRRALETFVGNIAPVRPDWQALFNVVGQLIDIDERAPSLVVPAAHVEMHTTLASIRPDLDVLGFPEPLLTSDPDSGAPFRAWALDLMVDLAKGRWPGESG